MKAALIIAAFALPLFQGGTAAAQQTRSAPSQNPQSAPVADRPLATARTSENAGFLTGNQLYSRCTETSPTSSSFCFAFIAGVHDTVRAYETWLKIREFCPPADVAQSDMRNSFMAYAKQRPASLSGQAASVVVAALKAKYPCPVQ
ncbi:MAG: hypothetical protein CMN72_02730 [Sphingomonas sp.]|nr:hypothetical protein [Sphingomonas sp.]